MTGESRGQRLQARLERAGVTYTELAREDEVYRGTVKKALSDDPSVTSTKWGAIEAAMKRLEREQGVGEPDMVVATDQGLVAFEVTGDFGVRVVVKGPVANSSELEAVVARLIQDIRQGRDPGVSGSETPE